MQVCTKPVATVAEVSVEPLEGPICECDPYGDMRRKLRKEFSDEEAKERYVKKVIAYFLKNLDGLGFVPVGLKRDSVMEWVSSIIPTISQLDWTNAEYALKRLRDHLSPPSFKTYWTLDEMSFYHRRFEGNLQKLASPS